MRALVLLFVCALVAACQATPPLPPPAPVPAQAPDPDSVMLSQWLGEADAALRLSTQEARVQLASRQDGSTTPAQRYRVALLDSPNNQAISEVRAYRGQFDSKYAAFYFPWVRAADPLQPGAIAEMALVSAGSSSKSKKTLSARSSASARFDPTQAARICPTKFAFSRAITG